MREMTLTTDDPVTQASNARVPCHMTNASFSNVVPSGYGTSPRNVLRSPGRTNLDLSVTKTTPLFRERITLELRVDAFNVLNHTEFNNLDNNAQGIGSTFGQVTGAYDPRILQLGTHLRF